MHRGRPSHHSAAAPVGIPRPPGLAPSPRGRACRSAGAAEPSWRPARSRGTSRTPAAHDETHEKSCECDKVRHLSSPRPRARSPFGAPCGLCREHGEARARARCVRPWSAGPVRRRAVRSVPTAPEARRLGAREPAHARLNTRATDMQRGRRGGHSAAAPVGMPRPLGRRRSHGGGWRRGAQLTASEIAQHCTHARGGTTKEIGAGCTPTCPSCRPAFRRWRGWRNIE